MSAHFHSYLCGRIAAEWLIEMNDMDSFEWLLCPVCNSKTRIKLRLDTELKNFPLFCPKCKQETLISVEKFKILVITEPDAQTQSR